MSTESRFLWADVVRVLAIFLVIQIHTSSFMAEYDFLSGIFKNVLSISVPLFVILSGSLILDKVETYEVFISRRVLKLLIPWIVWTFIYMFYNFYFHNDIVIKEFFSNGYASILQWIKFYLQYFLSVLWFLPMIFGIYLITPFIRKLVKGFRKEDNLYFLIVWFVGFSVMPYLINNPVFPIWNPSFVMAPIQFSGYFVLGYLIHKKNLFSSLPLRLVLFLAILPIVISMIPLNNYYTNNISSGFLSPGTAISALMFFAFFYRFLNDREKHFSPQLRWALAICAKSVFGVYLIHGILLDLSYGYLNDFFSYTNTLVFSGVIFFVLCLILVIFIKRLPIIRYIFT